MAAIRSRARPLKLSLALGAIVAAAGCSKEPQSVQATAEAIRKEWPADFRGYNWGAPLLAVLEEERKRSKQEGNQTFRTQLAGYPVILRFSSQGDMLAGAQYTFPWPREAIACTGIMTPGSECSLKSAAYAIEVCDRMDQLLAQKYQVDPKVHGYGNQVKMIERSVDFLDRSLRRPNDFMVLERPKAGERTVVFQGFGESQKDGQGWRCTLVYTPSPEIAEAIDQRAKELENEAAKVDL